MRSGEFRILKIVLGLSLVLCTPLAAAHAADKGFLVVPPQQKTDPSLATAPHAGPKSASAGGTRTTNPPPSGDGRALPVANTALSGLPTEAVLVEGLADFLASRAKQEAVGALLRDLERSARGDTVATCLFPRSLRVLREVEHTGYRAVTPTFASAMSQDVAALPLAITDISCIEHLMAGGDTSRAARERADQVKERLKWVRRGVLTLQAVRAGRSPILALSELAASGAITGASDTLRLALTTLGILARDYSVNRDSLRTRILNVKAASEYGPKVAGEIMKAPWYGKLETSLKAVVTGWQSNDATQLIQLMVAIRALDETTQRLRIESSGGSSQGTLSAGAELAQDVAVIMEQALKLLPAGRGDEYRAGRISRWLETAIDFESAILNSQWGQLMSLLIETLDEMGRAPSAPAVRYMTLTANLLSSRTSGDVQAALEAAADPIGSFRAKRWRDDAPAGFGLGVNGYVGACAGWEKLPAGSGANRRASAWGLSGLIGLEGSWGLPGKWFSSLSLFVSALDLGSVISYRESGVDGLSASPQAGFRQVVAPGAFVVLGISRDHPVSIGGGFERLPELRADTNGEKRDVLRSEFFIAVDTRLFTLKTAGRGEPKSKPTQ